MQAARAVTIEYEELPAVVSIEDAIAAKSYFRASQTIESGDVETALASADHVLEGEHRMGGQEHFYLEPHGSIVVPLGEDGETEVFP